MRLIDANIFIYASGAEHPYREPSLRILDQVQGGSLAANTDIEVFQEILHFYHIRDRTDFGVGVMRSAATQFAHAFDVTAPVMLVAASVLKDNPQVQARDAVHAAVVLHYGLEGIISADRGFDAISGIRRFDPRDL